MGTDAEKPQAPAGQPLGELLVSRGLITPEQLDEALAEHGSDGRPLGEILIGLGFATAHIIGQALATQHGGILKSEYGFATGFDAALATGESDTPPPVTARRVETPRPSRPDPGVIAGAENLRMAPIFRSPPDPVAAPRAEQALTYARADAPANPPARPVTRLIDLGQDPGLTVTVVDESATPNVDLQAQTEQAMTELEIVQSQLAVALGAIEAAQREREAELSELRENIVRLEAKLEDARHEAAEAATRGQAEAARIVGQLETALAERDAALAERDIALANPTPASSADPPEETQHLVFFPSTDRGYLLLERTGPPPAVGDILDVSADGGSSVAHVTKVARCPVPGLTIRCAYLV